MRGTPDELGAAALAWPVDGTGRPLPLTASVIAKVRTDVREYVEAEPGMDLEEIVSAALHRAVLQLVAEPGARRDAGPRTSFQSRVRPWMLACFGEEVANDPQQRASRFAEEAMELVQAAGGSAEEAHAMVDYVFSRPAGEPAQEVGGVMTTLASLSLAFGLDMHTAGEAELARVWTKVDQIRAKRAGKPDLSRGAPP